MTTDIIDRLRGPAPSILAMRDAANEIERLRRLRNDLLAECKSLRRRFHACVLASGSDPEFAGAACTSADAVIARATEHP